MKRLTYSIVALLIAATIGQVDALGVKRGAKVTQSPAAQVTKEVSILDQIVEQARIIVEATGPMAHKTRATAKAELNRLTKDLDSSVKNVIADDLETIKATGKTVDSKKTGRQAYERLIAAINSINAQANVVVTIEEGRNAIDRAPANMKKDVVAELLQNIQVAEKEAAKASMMNRVIAGVQSTLAMPGDYIFGKERTKAKTAFEAAVGALLVAGAAYGTYKLTPEGTGEAITTTGRKYWAKGKKSLGRDLTLEPKIAIDEPLTMREQYEENKLAAQKQGSWYNYFTGRESSEQPVKSAPSTWTSYITEGASNLSQQVRDIYNRTMYGTPERERSRDSARSYEEI